MRTKGFAGAIGVAGSLLVLGVAAVGAAAPGPSRPTPALAGASPLSPASQLSGKVQPRGDGKPVSQPLWVDGCDHNYADASGKNEELCVPFNAPRGKVVNCAYLKAIHIGPLKVEGVDSKHLAGGSTAAVRGAIVCPG
jgi:hypothetical protein